MIHGTGIGTAKNITINYPGIKPEKINKVENVNYVFLDLAVAANAKPGIVKFAVSLPGNSHKIDYKLNSRRSGQSKLFAQGVTSKDFIYLVLPERFSNGDPSNDRIPGMRDQSLNRDTVFNRPGDDLKGITNHLDYLQDLGVTTLWLNPVLENDMPARIE